jgi:hypothetical protein
LVGGKGTWEGGKEDGQAPANGPRPVVATLDALPGNYLSVLCKVGRWWGDLPRVAVRLPFGSGPSGTE